MRILSVAEETTLASAVQVLREGGVLVFPTETTYGIGCDARNAEAVARVFAIKGRPTGKGLPVLIPSLAFAESFVEVDDSARALTSRFWPGGVNMALPVKSDSVLSEACAQDGFQSVRVSSHPFAARLVREFNGPVVATSANVSGMDPLYSVESVEANFVDQPDAPDLVVDAGILPPQPPSTIAKIVGGRVQILRQGSVVIPSIFL